MIRIENLSDDTQNNLTKALLESSLLFVHSHDKIVGIQRNEVFLKTVFAIIVSENKPCDNKQIVSVFSEKFHKGINPDEIDKAIGRLEFIQWIHKENGGYVPNAKIAKIMKDDVADIEQRKQNLIQELVDKLQTELEQTLSQEERSKVTENIKLTLNLYVRLHDMEFLISKDDDISDNDNEVSDEDIINQAKTDLPNEVGNMLIEVLSDLIAHPTTVQKTTLSLLVKTLIGAQIMQVDPQLSQLQVDRIKDKNFVLDTDFLLSSMVKNLKESNEFKTLISKLRRIGCQLMVPNEVIAEIVKHVQNAEGNYSYFRNTYNATDPKDIEEYATNVFVRDYYLSKEKNRNSFKDYLNNKYYDRDAPRPLIETIITKELHLPLAADDALSINDDLQHQREDLEKKIRETTRQSPKSKHRKEDEIASLAETDAKLFLYVLSQNQHAVKVHNGDLLSGTTYLITCTEKSIRCAKDMGLDCRYVTRPEILINILYEIGILDDAKDELFNLFENPFLTHVINENWETIKKLSNLGVILHDKSYSKLDRDLGEAMNQYLSQKADYEKIPETDRTEDVKLKVANEYVIFLKEAQRKHYKLMPEVQVIADSITKKDEELEEERRKRVEAQAKYAKKEYRQKHYEDMIKNNKNGKKSQQGKRKKKRFHK